MSSGDLRNTTVSAGDLGAGEKYLRTELSKESAFVLLLRKIGMLYYNVSRIAL